VGVPDGAMLRFRYGEAFAVVELGPAPGLPEPPPMPVVGPVVGEVDFVLSRSKNTTAFSERFLHLEVAVKFYCVSCADPQTWNDFIAPNPHDKLGIKLRRMLDHQLHMGRTPHICSLLAQPNMLDAPSCEQVSPDDVRSVLLMTGRLFYQAKGRLDSAGTICPTDFHEQVAILSPELEIGWGGFFS